MVSTHFHKYVMSACLVVALLLMSWGNLRFVISPLGYWLCWLGWALLTVISLRVSGKSVGVLVKPPAWVMASYAFLLAGILLAALANADTYTAYQGIKVLVIASLFYVMWRLVQELNCRQMYTLLCCVVMIVASCFFLFKWFHPGHFIQGDGREGYVFANVGILWKSGTFFLPLLLAGAVSLKPSAWFSGAAVGAALYLALIDGSRTALLLIVLIFIGFFVCVAVRRELGNVLRRSGWMWFAALVVAGLFGLNTVTNNWHSVRPLLLGASATDQVVGYAKEGFSIEAEAFRLPVSKVVNFVNVSEGNPLAPPAIARMQEGDEIRIRLLENALAKVGPCFLLGCGFGAATSGTGGLSPSMPVHNAYLASLVDFGVLGLLGALGFLVAAGLPLLKMFHKVQSTPSLYFSLLASVGALAYAVSLALHTFTSEMSEWGYVIFLLALAWVPFRSVDLQVS